MFWKRSISVFLVLLLVISMCVMFSSCRDRVPEEDDTATSSAVQEESKDAEKDSKTEAKESESKDTESKAEENSDTETVEPATTDNAADEDQSKEESSAKKKSAEKKSDNSSQKKSSKKKSSKSDSKKSEKSKSEKSEKSEKAGKSEKSEKSEKTEQPKEKKKVWVEPVTETRTVTLDTGTRYCCGANSNGGCGASWHGSKDSTYNSWHKHWQDYVKKRTKEEAEKGNTYVCDHIHDDSRWEPDTTTEEVVIQEGYWKEVD